ncbi:hypothetical protein QBE52_11280 [Clostridiaceae bacterium 35-E11]
MTAIYYKIYGYRINETDRLKGIKVMCCDRCLYVKYKDRYFCDKDSTIYDETKISLSKI